MFKLTGPTNPPKKGGLIMVEGYKKGGRLGQIQHVEMFSRAFDANGDPIHGTRQLRNPTDTLFLSPVEWSEKEDACSYSPFGDIGFELEIVWIDDNVREWWVLHHPEPTAIGSISKEQADDAPGTQVVYKVLKNKLAVLVA